MKKKHLQQTINNIEKSITEKIDVETLSSECFISPRQLYRDFYALTGHSVNEYIRKRKLSKALSLLKHSELSITDIAYSCGYSSVQALCRSIKTALNITPTQYRSSTDTYYFPVYDEMMSKKITVGNQIISQMICVRYYNSQYIGIENKAVSYLMSSIPDYTGKVFGRNGAQNGNRFCYELYIEHDENHMSKLTASFEKISVCPGYTATFACTSSINKEHEINAAWDFLYGHWLKSSMFEQDNTSYFEEYIIKDSVIKKLILHLPIKTRENFYKINIKPFDERLYIIASQSGLNAEKSASNMIVNFVAEHYPFLLKTQKEFYMAKHDHSCVCGMNIDNRITIPENKNVTMLRVSDGLYAVLEGSCFGSGNEYEQILLGWLYENGFETIGKPFSIYDTSKGTQQNKIIVKSQVMIKDGRI